MKKYSTGCLLLVLLAFLTASAFAAVTVTEPANGTTSSSPVTYKATATASTCSKGVASMGVYVDYNLVYVVNGTSLDTSVSMSSGSHYTVVEEWDYCGGATYTPINLTISNSTGVWVTSPAENSTVSSPVLFAATASTTCSKGVASMGVYIDNVLTYVNQGGATLNVSLSVGSGSHHTVLEEWDYCGGAAYTARDITVSGGSSGSTLWSLQNSGGWVSYGEYPPKYNICTNCGSGVTFWMKQGISSPSLDGKAAEFELGGTTPYSDVLFTNPLIGTNSSQGLPDSNHTLIPSLHNFAYDAYFYTSDLSVAQVLEFDISMYFDSLSLIFGHQCNILGGNVWDIWDNGNHKWVSTGISCYPNNNAWNHVTLQVQRTSSNQLLYQSITLNGVTHTLNWYYSPGSAPSSWWGITVNYQMDGNYKQSSYTTYLDEFNFTYW